MSGENIRDRIKASLAEVPGADFAAAAEDLLAVLGYRSELTLDNQSSIVEDFISRFPLTYTDTKSEKAFRQSAKSVSILFQLTDYEITAVAQRSLFNAGEFDTGNARSFLFAAVQLNEDSYPRTKYAAFAREINKRWQIPTVVVFKTTADFLTLAFVNRREHKLKPELDVLGRVSLVREIHPIQPHRAHLDILSELSLADRMRWMEAYNKPHNFDGLLAAWLDALDTEELNRRFYKELFAWFEWAVAVARFPTTGTKVLPPEEHVIRLITRLLFVWFIKEKNLIADELFNEAQIGSLLRDYDRVGGDSYYRAVLQNLFFATLNTEIERCGFSKRTNDTHRDFSRYRYEDEMSEPERLLALFRQTPFINGGLFDCLDSETAPKDGGYRIDCFTDNVTDPGRKEYGILSIPNRLFFDDTGLISLFNRYKFTVEENTPAEQEVALDPELLGKVFENLLAAYNPETRETARKQTGSYYTPRVVVDYMVDEALVATLAEACPPADGDFNFWQDRLRYLLTYDAAFDDAEDLFAPEERESVIRAISEIKVIDPAVGSGAFPMGILHKLTLALRRIDTDNKRWESLQKEIAGHQAAAAFDAVNQQERDAELREISDTFEKYRDSDFGRKLYLIQNSIFGVDIQPVACQIAKLRFFISLAIEQEPTEDADDNFGIKPLPNLETRFLAANTLVGLELSNVEPLLQHDSVQERLRDIFAIRDKYFLANSRRQKLRNIRRENELREHLRQALGDQRTEWIERQQREIDRKVALVPNKEDQIKLRNELAKDFELRRQKFDSNFGNAQRISEWVPYDQNAHADWFDAEYMFGITEGYDVVIGNPPYVQLQKNGGKLGRRYKDAGFATFVRTGDVYQLFYEKGCRLLKAGRGLLAYITSNSWLRAEYGKSTRRYFSDVHTPLRLLEMGKDVFENTIVDTNILLLRHGKVDANAKAVDMDRLPDKEFPPDERLWGQLRPQGERPWSPLSAIEHQIMGKMEAAGTPLKDWDVSINFGVKTGYNKAFIIDDAIRQTLVTSDPNSADIIKPVLRGRDIQRYLAHWGGKWLIDMHNGYGDVPAVDIYDYPAVKDHLDESYPQLEVRHDQGRTPYNLRNCAYHEDFAKAKLVWIELVERGRFAYDHSGVFCEATSFLMTGGSLKYLWRLT